MGAQRASIGSAPGFYVVCVPPQGYTPGEHGPIGTAVDADVERDWLDKFCEERYVTLHAGPGPQPDEQPHAHVVEARFDEDDFR